MERIPVEELRRTLGIGLLTLALAVPGSPLAWAQLGAAVAGRDPVLAATIEAAIKIDPDFQKDPELKAAVEKLATDCLTDPRTRAEVASEVTQVRAEGGVERVIPKEVLTAVRTEASTTFAAKEAEMRKGLEALPANSSERKMAELSMEHGKQVMEAYARGEAAPAPPREMVAHAQEMFKEWSEKSGASQRDIEMAKFAMERFASGEMTGGGMGPGGFAGPTGPGGREMGPPSDQQLKAMADAGHITPEQLAKMQADKQAWESGDASKREELMKQYAGEGFRGGMEGMPHGGFEGFAGGTGPREGFGPTAGFEGFAAGPRETYVPGPHEGFQGGGFSPRELEQFAPQVVQYREAQQQTQEFRQELQLIQQQSQQERFEMRLHHHQDGSDHPHTVHIHTDGTVHDHTATSPVNTAPGAVYVP